MRAVSNSLLYGNSKYISRARQSLPRGNGWWFGLAEMSLVSFDPEKRATASDVLNSCFMEPLREAAGEMLYNPDDTILIQRHIISYCTCFGSAVF
jgi:hypothetical protein